MTYYLSDAWTLNLTYLKFTSVTYFTQAIDLPVNSLDKGRPSMCFLQPCPRTGVETSC